MGDVGLMIGGEEGIEGKLDIGGKGHEGDAGAKEDKGITKLFGRLGNEAVDGMSWCDRGSRGDLCPGGGDEERGGSDNLDKDIT